MKLFWVLFATFSVSFAAAADDCMSTDQIQAIIADFKVRAEPLLNSFILPTEIVYKDIPLLANDPISSYVDVGDKTKYKVSISGKKCDGYLGDDEFRFLLCHELGHLAGGAPYMTFIGHEKNILSAEGQADYFATSSCLPGIFTDDENAKYLEKAKAEPHLNTLCAEGDDQARGLCMRVLSASLSFARFVSLTPAPNPFGGGASSHSLPQLDGRDNRVVAKTLTREYPSPQCRLQTMIAGFQSRAESTLRPACWYKSE